ncbi:MAG: hypothetical protein GKR98_04035 [Boseongicola sp.]|nr:MAG: hypothetical protein GKR98_04035 [Boseongicola sp.]
MGSPAFAEDWVVQDGDGIRAALEGRVVDYDDAWQDFRVSGRTLYNAGENSWGNWEVRGDRYCSQWPPSQGWDCYELDVSADGSGVRFRGEHGDTYVATYRGTE